MLVKLTPGVQREEEGSGGAAGDGERLVREVEEKTFIARWSVRFNTRMFD